MRHLSILLALFLTLNLTGCKRSTAREPGPMRVVVTIPPLKGLVEPLLPPGSEVTILLPPGQSEHGWEPRQGDLKAIARADLCVAVGLGLESSFFRVLPKVGNTRRIDVTFAELVGLESAGASVEAVKSDPHAGHDHHDHEGHDHSHDHSGADPHLWLDPGLCLEFVSALAPVVEKAARAAGANEPEVVRTPDRAGELEARITQLDAECRRLLEPVKGRAIVTHHAAFGRFAERYGLRVVEVIRPVEGVEPTTGQIAAVMDMIKKENVQAIFAEPQYMDRSVDQIARQAGVEVGRLDPLGSGDWFAMMRANAEELAARLAP